MQVLGVCGLGKLGSPIAAVFAAAGLRVVGYDIDTAKAWAIIHRKPPVEEPFLERVMSEAEGNLTAVTHLTEMVEQTEGCIFVTPTPSLPDGSFEHGYLRTALIKVSSKAAYIKKRNYAFIVTSTVMPGYLAGEGAHILKTALGDLGYRLAYKPEFIALGTVIEDLRNPDFLLLGAEDEDSLDYTEALYRRLVRTGAPVKRMSLTEAELAKISLNCAVTMKISFANQVAMVAEGLGISARRVLESVGCDHRIGPAQLRPGLPYGGPCFPRDARMFRYVANRVGKFAPLASATDAINELMLGSIAQRVPETGSVGILGLAYKPGTAVTEESPGLRLKGMLEQHGRQPKAHDVQAPHPDSLDDVMACNTVVIMCDWPEYAGLQFPRTTLVIDPFGITDPAGRVMERVA